MARARFHFEVPPKAEEHMLQAHDVTPEEAVEAARGAPFYEGEEDASPPRALHSRGRRYTIAGKTISGRRLWIVFEDMGDGVARIITAIPPRDKAQQQRHRRQRGD